NKHFTHRAFWITPDGDGEVLTPKPQVKGFAGAALGEGSPHSGASSTSLAHASHPGRGLPRQFNSIFGTFGKYCSIIWYDCSGFTECTRFRSTMTLDHCVPGAGAGTLPRGTPTGCS